MSDWTPSTEQVRSHYVFNQSNQWDPERGEAFDRWLTEHDRQVAERAWDEGYNAGHYVETEKHECDCPRANPYRKEQENTNA